LKTAEKRILKHIFSDNRNSGSQLQKQVTKHS